MIALEAKNLTKTFHDRATGNPFQAVKNISFQIEDGQFVTLLGPSGCGKTTILRMIAGFESPTEGELLAFGKPLNSVVPEKRELPVVFQNYALFPHMTVFDNVAYPLKIKKWKRDLLTARVEETLALMNLSSLARRHPHEMSGGQQQRVALARALVAKPKIILFDEPLSNLDAKLRQQMRFELKRLQRQFGLTSLYVTHDQEEAMALSDRVMIMNQGSMEQEGSPEDIYFRPCSRFVADFIGKANFAQAEIIRSGSRYDIRLWGEKITGVHGLPGLAGTCDVMLRPEAIHLTGGGSGHFEATLTLLSFLGNLTLCELDIGGIRILAERASDPRDSEVQLGTKVTFTLDPIRLFVLPQSNGDHLQSSSSVLKPIEEPRHEATC